jgi:hypothetical protein
MPQVWHLPLEEPRAALDPVGIPHRTSNAQSQTIPKGELLSVAPPPAVVLGSRTRCRQAFEKHPKTSELGLALSIGEC